MTRIVQGLLESSNARAMLVGAIVWVLLELLIFRGTSRGRGGSSNRETEPSFEWRRVRRSVVLVLGLSLSMIVVLRALDLSPLEMFLRFRWMVLLDSIPPVIAGLLSLQFLRVRSLLGIPRTARLATGVAACVLLLLVAITLATIADGGLDGIWEGASSSLVVAEIAFIVLAAIAEEAFFRGAILFAIAERLGIRIAIGLSAVFFAAMHARRVSDAVSALVVGVAFGALTAKSSSVWPAALVHIGINLLVKFVEG